MWLNQGQSNDKAASLSQSAFHLNLSVVQLHNPLHNGQAKSAAAAVTGAVRPKADVQISDVSSFHTAQFGDGQISDQAAQNGAVLAINADNYAVHDYGVIIRDGQLLRAHDTTRHMLALLPDGSL